MQTKNPVTYISRGINATEIPKADREISAQPTFRQESLEKAVSEKLDEIEWRAKEHSKRKKNYQRISYRPPGNFAQVTKPTYQPLHEISNKYKRMPGHLRQNLTKAYPQRRGDYTPKDQRPDDKNKNQHRKHPFYEREKRVDSLSENEIHSAVKTLLY